MPPLASNQLTSRAVLDVPDERSANRKSEVRDFRIVRQMFAGAGPWS